MRFCTAGQVLDGRLAALDDLRQAGLGGGVALLQHLLLRLQYADDGVGLGQQFLQIAGERHVADALGAHALLRCRREDADEGLPAGEAFHALEFGAEDVGGVLQPDDQVGDVAFHDLLLLEHVLDAGVLDVEVGGADLFVGPGDLVEHGAGLLDLGAHLLHDLLGLGNLGIEVLQCRHIGLSRLRMMRCGIYGGRIAIERQERGTRDDSRLHGATCRKCRLMSQADHSSAARRCVIALETT